MFSACMFIRKYERLIAWQEAHKLCLRIYDETSKFPKSEQFRLVDQMRRASYSVPMNIAEGCGKRSLKERTYFYEIAACSLEEVHYQHLLARDLKYVSQEQFESVDSHIGRVSYLLNRLRGILP